MSGSFRFEGFTLDLPNRRLLDGERPVEVSSRYFDALVLLVREAGALVPKERFMTEVWRGVPVTDEALTQCIRTLRRQLGDAAGRPRLIETVPKHGYRFIAAVEEVASAADAGAPAAGNGRSWRTVALVGAAGIVGGGMAGLIGGIFYGFAGAAQPLAPGVGAASILLVLVSLTTMVAMIGAAGVAFGIAAAGFGSGRSTPWIVVGGAAGGLLVGAIAKLLGLDAFNLLLGRSPGDIAGAAEGALLGGAVGLGAWLASRSDPRVPLRRTAAAAALAGGMAGVSIPLLGGRLFGGSLDLLARQFPDSRLRLDEIGALLGESGFGRTTQIVTGGLEGALFGACMVAAMVIAMRNLAEERVLRPRRD